MIDYTGMSGCLARLHRGLPDSPECREITSALIRESRLVSVAIHDLLCRLAVSEKIMKNELFYGVQTTSDECTDHIIAAENDDGTTTFYYRDPDAAQLGAESVDASIHSVKVSEKPIGFTQLVAVVFRGEVEV